MAVKDGSVETSLEFAVAHGHRRLVAAMNASVSPDTDGQHNIVGRKRVCQLPRIKPRASAEAGRMKE